MFGSARKTLWLAALAGVTGFLSAPAAQAQGVRYGCIGGYGSFVCTESWGGGVPRIIQLRAPETDEEIAAFRSRDRRWAARCKPRLHRDRYGVGRYTYAAPGCAFGRTDD